MGDGEGTIAANYLFALTLLLAPVLDERHERALLENAVDVLPDINHRNVIRCRLAHHAAVEGDQAAAEHWLAPVDPRPRDLMADTAYRLAVSYIALTRRQAHGVFQQLGRNEGDAPIFDGYDEEAFLLRCHALEATGHEDEAFARLGRRLLNSAHFAPLLALARHDPRFELCPRVLPRLEKAQWSIYERRLRPSRYDWSAMVFFIALLAVAGMVIAWLASEVRWVTPLRGEDAFMLVGIGWLVPVCLAAAYRAYRTATRNVSLHDDGVMTFARVLWSSNGNNPELGVYQTRVVAAVVHEGVAYEATGWLDTVVASISGDHPALFDPQTRQLKVVAPQPSPVAMVIVPFG